jgi:hypothetical protein
MNYKYGTLDNLSSDNKIFLWDTYHKQYPNLVECLFRHKRRIPMLHFNILLHKVAEVKAELELGYIGPLFKTANYVVNDPMFSVDGMHLAGVSGNWDIIMLLVKHYNKHTIEYNNKIDNPYTFLYLYAQTWDHAYELYINDINTYGLVNIGNLLTPFQEHCLKYNPKHFNNSDYTTPVKSLRYYALLFNNVLLTQWINRLSHASNCTIEYNEENNNYVPKLDSILDEDEDSDVQEQLELYSDVQEQLELYSDVQEQLELYSDVPELESDSPEHLSEIDFTDSGSDGCTDSDLEEPVQEPVQEPRVSWFRSFFMR